MVKLLEIVGFVLVAIMALGFMGILQPTINPGLSPLFWVCAGGALMIIIYRKVKNKKVEEEKS